MSHTKIITKSENSKKDKKRHYSLDKLYYATIDDHESIICETFINHKPKYIEIFTIPEYSITNRTLIDGFKLKKSLKEEIDSKKINVCLISKDGKEKRELTIEEITNIIKLTNLLDRTSFDYLNPLCTLVSNQISDLLGINIKSNPSSNLRLSEIDEVVVPASKAQKFRELLFNYIKISVILDNSITISNNDYRIKRALNGCKIKTQEIENEFTMIVDSNGQIIIECENMIKGFQKPFRNKSNKKA